jgi:hypothetical protein
MLALLRGPFEHSFCLPSVPESVTAGLADFLEGDQGFLLNSNLLDLSGIPERLPEALPHRLQTLQYVLSTRHFWTRNSTFPDNKLNVYK